MRVKLTFKTPDVIDTALEVLDPTGEKYARFRKVCDEWVEYGEYLTVVIDDEAGTCTVVPVENK